MKTINSNYAYINGDNITLYEESKSFSPLREQCLKDVEITFLQNGIIKIKGNILIYGFTFNGFYVKENETKICKSEIKMVFDLFSLKKRPYVKQGWYRLNETKSVEIIKNKYEITTMK